MRTKQDIPMLMLPKDPCCHDEDIPVAVSTEEGAPAQAAGRPPSRGAGTGSTGPALCSGRHRRVSVWDWGLFSGSGLNCVSVVIWKHAGWTHKDNGEDIWGVWSTTSLWKRCAGWVFFVDFQISLYTSLLEEYNYVFLVGSFLKASWYPSARPVYQWRKQILNVWSCVFCRSRLFRKHSMLQMRVI